MTVTAPNGGEWFKGGDIFNITWDAADDYLADKPIRIEYDNGTGLVLIAANEENDGTYEWTVPTGVNINTAKIRVSATDKAGNIGFDESDSSFVIDNTAPVITEPVDISVPADAGKSTAIVDVEWPTVVDNFDDNPTVTGVRDDGKDLDDPYPVGTTKITWTATDKVGNTSTAEQTVVVLTIAKMDVEVYLDGDITGTFTRPITFVIGGEGGGPVGPMTLVENVEFTDGFGTVELDVPANGVWTVISAKDEKHTLRKQVEVTIPDGSTRYFATFESNTLTGGDLTNDNMIDILDFSVLVSQYGTSGGTVRDANINGDLKVDTGDFTFIQINFLKVGEAEPSKSAGPVTAPPANGSTSVKARKAVEAANIGLSNV
ncbi:MAG TPA: HYR domain-containing protein, partial [Armatimonadota bacterium]|nr:HYR domain-containing protein [Armatimonadota bacterium]